MRAALATTALAASASLASARPNSRLHARQDMCMVDTVIGPDTAQIEASINQWQLDINTVNSYLNDVASGALSTADPNGLLAATQNALSFASDEPCQLATLGSQVNINDPATDPQFSCAVLDLMRVFKPHVIDNLNNIIANPADATAVAGFVLDINNFRCCNVLPDAGILILESAEGAGLVGTVDTTVARENACSSITCTLSCGAPPP